MTGYCPYSPLQQALQLKYGYDLADAIMENSSYAAQKYIDSLPTGYEDLPKSYYTKIYEDNLKNLKNTNNYKP